MKEGEHRVNSELLAKLKETATLPEEQIDHSDPDAPFGTDWTKAVRGKFCRPSVSVIHLRAWLDTSKLAVKLVDEASKTQSPKGHFSVHLKVISAPTRSILFRRFDLPAYKNTVARRHAKKYQRVNLQLA